MERAAEWAEAAAQGGTTSLVEVAASVEAATLAEAASALVQATA